MDRPSKRYAIAACLVAAMAVPAVADAQFYGYTTRNVNVRAGPDRSYPLVGWLQDGTNVEIFGCLDSWRWCDLQGGVYRGWAYAGFLAVPYQGGWATIRDIGPESGLPLLSFEVTVYWNTFYTTWPWYAQWPWWASRPPIYIPPWRPPVRPPVVHPRPPIGVAPPRPPVVEPPIAKPPGGKPPVATPRPPTAVPPATRPPFVPPPAMPPTAVQPATRPSGALPPGVPPPSINPAGPTPMPVVPPPSINPAGQTPMPGAPPASPRPPVPAPAPRPQPRPAPG